MKPYKILALRKIALPLLKKFSRDITIKHPWLKNKKISLNLFKHKGYWYHGKNRERKTMELFNEIIQPNTTVAEVGGHIGYITLYFQDLINPDGKVFVFEPGTNNLPYIKKNIDSHENITLIEKAVGNKIDTVDFYEDDLTGQNNSVIKDFDGLKNNSELSYVSSKVSKVTVPLTTLDNELKDHKIDFIKIDIEGGEWGAICGAEQILTNQHPALMIEIQANEQEIYNKLSTMDYILFDESCRILTSPSELKGNTFCLQKISHQQLIATILPNL